MKAVFVGLLAVVLATPTVGHAQVASAPAAAPSDAIDPDRLALGTKIAAKLFPDGLYREMMEGTLDQLMRGMTDQIGMVPIKEILAAAGLPEDNLAKMEPATLDEITAIIDPHFKERVALLFDIMMPELIDFMTTKEPLIREGMAEAYAKRFTHEELVNISAFFDTSTGGKFAAQSTLVMTDPAVIGRMQAIMPEMLKLVPTLIGKAVKQFEKLPQPRKFADLTDAERTKLASILGIDVDQLSSRFETND